MTILLNLDAEQREKPEKQSRFIILIQSLWWSPCSAWIKDLLHRKDYVWYCTSSRARDYCLSFVQIAVIRYHYKSKSKTKVFNVDLWFKDDEKHQGPKSERVESLYLDLQLEGRWRERYLEWLESLETSKLTPVTLPFQQSHTSYFFPNNYSNWGPNMKQNEPMGPFSSKPVTTGDVMVPGEHLLLFCYMTLL